MTGTAAAMLAGHVGWSSKELIAAAVFACHYTAARDVKETIREHNEPILPVGGTVDETLH